MLHIEIIYPAYGKQKNAPLTMTLPGMISISFREKQKQKSNTRNQNINDLL